MPDIDATEAAAEFAAEHGIDLAGVTGSGAGGRITKGDVEAVAKATEATPGANEPKPATPDLTSPGVATRDVGDADVQNGLTEPERRRLFVADVTADMRPGNNQDEPAADQIGPVEGPDPEWLARARAAAESEGPGWSEWASEDDYLGKGPAAIRAASSIQELLTMDVDRVKYAGALQARAKELLEHKP